MRKFCLSVLSLVLFAGFTATAFAGEVKTGKDGAKCITISGAITLDNVTRSPFFGDIDRVGPVSPQNQYGQDLSPGLYGAPGNNWDRGFDIFDGRNSNWDNFSDPTITLSLDIELVDNVRGFLQLENHKRDRYPNLPIVSVADGWTRGDRGPILVGGSGTGASGYDANGGLNQGWPYTGTGRQATQRGGDDNLWLAVEQAFIEWDTPVEGLRMRAGISDLEYDLRGDGNAFFLDIAESEGIGPEIIIPGVLNKYQPIQRQEFSGWIGTHTLPELFGGSLFTDVFLGTLVETGFWNQDQKIYGFNFDWKTDTSDPDISNTLRFMTTMFNTDSSSYIVSHNIGADWNLVNVGGGGGNLELFTEWVFQYGEFASAQTLENLYPQRFLEDHPDKLAPPSDRRTSYVGSDILTQPAGASRSDDYVSPYSNDQEQDSWGGYFGLKYTQANSEYRPWAEFMYMAVSGDDGGFGGDAGKLYQDNEDFVSFEDNDATLIVEDNDYGLDIDDNYWKIQVSGGASLAPLFNNEVDLNVKVLYAFFEAFDTPWTIRDNIGNELDVVFTWNYSQDLTMELAGAWLWGNETFVDLSDYAYLHPNSPLSNISEDAFSLRLSTSLRF